jgi:hypothetical protein
MRARFSCGCEYIVPRGEIHPKITPDASSFHKCPINPTHGVVFTTSIHFHRDTDTLFPPLDTPENVALGFTSPSHDVTKILVDRIEDLLSVYGVDLPVYRREDVSGD